MHNCILKYLGLQNINIKFHGDRHLKCVLLSSTNSVFNPFGRNNTLFLKLLPFRILHSDIFVSFELIDFILIDFIFKLGLWDSFRVNMELSDHLSNISIFIANLLFDKSTIMETSPGRDTGKNHSQTQLPNIPFC